MLDLFAYERETDNALVARGRGPAGLASRHGHRGRRDLRTQYGALSYSMREDGKRVSVRVEEGLRVPPGGVALVWPGDKAPGVATVNGKPVPWEDNELRIRELPATIVIDAR